MQAHKTEATLHKPTKPPANTMIRSPVLQPCPIPLMEEPCSDPLSRKRDRSPSPPSKEQSPSPCKTKGLHRLDSDCSVEVPEEAFIPSESDSISSKTKLRQEMLARIEERLDPNEPRRTCLARKLEALLFHNAPSFEIYFDTATLDSRIRLAAIALVSRKKLRKAQEVNDRRQVLLEILGNETYQQVCDTVKQVQDLRLLGAASCRCTTTCCRSKPIKPIPGQRVMPSAVRNLFFETKLIDATENTPLDKISSLDWKSMITEAERNMKAFREWSGLERPFGDEMKN